MGPYLTFDGNCQEAIDLYKKALGAEVLQIMRFFDLSASHVSIPKDYNTRVVQATLSFSSDCGSGIDFHDSQTEKISIGVEASQEDIQKAYDVFAEEGKISMALTQTFYSPCMGVDKFGIMWNFVIEKQ